MIKNTKTFLFKLKLKVLLLAVIAGVNPLFAKADISIESKVNCSTIHIGDVITYSVIVTHDPTIKLEMPSLAANLGMFEIRDYKVLEPVEKNGEVVSQTDYLISTFEIGEMEIPPLQIGYTVEGDSTKHHLKSEPINIVVESLNPDEAGDIRDIKSPIYLPRDYRKLILWSSLGLLLAGLGIFAFYYIKRRREGKSILPSRTKPPRPAHEVALEALEKLVQSDMLESGQVKNYYVEISDIIRTYIEGRYSIVALEMTTTQLLEKVRQEQIDSEIVVLLNEFLDSCDIVKFAKYIPTPQENEQTTQWAFDFVNKTKLVALSEPLAEEETEMHAKETDEAIAIEEEPVHQRMEEVK
jgi:hypothetical protein